MPEKRNKIDSHDGDQPISRKEALVKAGKYAAFTAAAMMTILDPANAGGGPPKSKPKPPRPRPHGPNKSGTTPNKTTPPTY